MDGIPPTKFQAIYVAGDVEAYTSTLRDAFMKCSDFARCKQDLYRSVESSPDVHKATATLVATLLSVWTDSTTPLAYLVLMTLSDLERDGVLPDDWHSSVLPGDLRGQVAEVVEVALTTHSAVSPKVVVKTLSLFRMDHVGTEIVRSYTKKLLADSAFVSVLKCIEHFTWIEWPHLDMLETFVASKSWPMAEQLLKIIQPALDAGAYRDLTKALVALSIHHQELKRAHRYLHQYNLQDEYPHLESVYRLEALNKLCAQQKWAIAANFVGNNSVLQMDLYHKMVAAGQIGLANDLRDRFDLSELGPRLDSNVAVEGTSYLSLDGFEIVWVDSGTAVHNMETYWNDVLAQEQICWIGLDVEWKAVFEKDEMAVASILQVAVGSRVFIVDLIRLETSDACFVSLQRLLTLPSFVKIGFGFHSDLKVLHQSFPDKCQPFQTVMGLFEIETILRKVCPTYTGKSLSDATMFLQGRPLDKRQQLSNWEARPLHSSQLQYAALDAACLIPMAKQLLELDPSLLPHHLSSTSLGHIHGDVVITKAQQYRQLRVQRITSTPTLSGNFVMEFLQAHPSGSQVEILPANDKTRQARDVIVANSLCLMVNSKPHVAILCHGTRLDLVQLAKLAGVTRRKVRFATPQECLQVFGYAPGTVPPIAHKAPDICVWLDKDVPPSIPLLFGGGPHCILKCTLSTLLLLVPHANVAALSVTPDVSSSGAVLEPKFLADSMLGRVAKWLRMTGVDILHWDIVANPNKKDMLALASSESRIILTRDRKLAQHREAFACYVVASDNVEMQFQEIKNYFGIEYHEAEFMSRCAKCNQKGFHIVETAQVVGRDDVPQKVLDTVDEFYECKTCRQLYWVGPKYSTAHAKMKQIFQ
ncbi:hypothetical protein H310_11653 [Aphanomyces invadans]|uniref:3'-5' exonuclease domain-containing protein n=1 Tax=Aphanomyces invadans TaxID=157072 RepID=A0A024TMS1_9STRA|nr:hypothetical protein H310_11653 [Aphanomyces invadans]ETV94667.1 hypothetical protein H310_11653 [Aphanomyces invadans]|eukprot:XP_008876612.1 hypothetical protein H310_11653 [Aphanomyces invadans]